MQLYIGIYTFNSICKSNITRDIFATQKYHQKQLTRDKLQADVDLTYPFALNIR